MTVSFAKRDAQFTKFDDEHRIAYGWAIVSSDNGKPYFDLQGDHIPVGVVLPAAIDFMKNSRAGDDMHKEVKTADIVFCAPVMKGTVVDPKHPQREGLWIGAQIHDDGVYQATKKGDRRGFSIGGFLDEADYIGKASKVRGDAMRTEDAEFVKRVLDAQIAKGAKPQRIFRSMRLAFVSTVDWPAQEGAMISIVKNAPREAVIALRKGVAFTSLNDGHQHMIDTDCFDERGRGWTSSAQSVLDGGDTAYHSHDMLIDSDGVITIGANLDHTHSVDDSIRGVLPAATQDASMTETVSLDGKGGTSYADGDASAKDKTKTKPKSDDKTKTDDSAKKGLVHKTNTALGFANKEPTNMDIEQLNKRIAELTAQKDALAKQAKTDADAVVKREAQLMTLSDSQRTYFGSLDTDERPAFLAKSQSARADQMKSAIEYTATDGTVYYKFDDARTVALAKRADESDKATIENVQLAKRAQFSKKASEVFGKAFPGTEDTHSAIIGAIEGITDEAVRKSAYEVFAAGRAALVSKQSLKGTHPMSKQAGEGGSAGGESTDNDPVAKARGTLRTAVENFAKANNIASYELAFAQATAADPECRRLYDAMYDAQN